MFYITMNLMLNFTTILLNYCTFYNNFKFLRAFMKGSFGSPNDFFKWLEYFLQIIYPMFLVKNYLNLGGHYVIFVSEAKQYLSVFITVFFYVQ